MALASNALTSIASLRAFMRNQAPLDATLMSVYHDESASATAATVQVTSSAVVLIITGGANAGTQTMTFAASATATAMVAAINTLAEGWVATAQGNGGEASSGLNVQAAATAFGLANENFLNGSDQFMQEQAINAATTQIERFCGRTFASTTYRHLFNGTGMPKLMLRQMPVTQVKRVGVDFDPGIRIQNTSSDARYATVENDGTSINLVVVGGDNEDSSSVAIGSNTLAELVVLINAVGNGWSAASESSTVEPWPASELIRHEGRSCLTQEIGLFVPGDFLDSYVLDSEAGILTKSGTDHAFRTGMFRASHGNRRDSTWPGDPHNPGSHLGGHWVKGNLNVFVHYVAGYETIPLDLEMICNKFSANIIRQGVRDGSLTSASSPEFSESYMPEGAFTNEIRTDLARFRLRPVPRFQDA